MGIVKTQLVTAGLDPPTPKLRRTKTELLIRRSLGGGGPGRSSRERLLADESFN